MLDGRVTIEDPVELFNRQRFSTAEAAKILDLPLATLKTRLARGWLPVADLEEGDRRHWTPDDLLRANLAEELSRRGIQFPDGRKVVSACAPTWFGGAVFLAVALDGDGMPQKYMLSGVPDLGVIIADTACFSAVVVSINATANWLRQRLDLFYIERDKL